MHFAKTIIALAAVPLAVSMPISGTISALRPRQSGTANNVGSTSTSTTNGNGFLPLFSSSGAAAADDGSNQTSTSATSCGIFTCSGAASSASGGGSSSSSSSAGSFTLFGMGKRALAWLSMSKA